MQISENKLRSIIRESVISLLEGQDDVYLELFNSIDTLSQLISKTKPDEIERKALSLFKNNSGREPKNESDSFVDVEGRNVSFSQLKSGLTSQYGKDVEDFIGGTLPLDTDLVAKYTAFARKIIEEQPFTSTEEIANQMGEMIKQDYLSLDGGGVAPRKGSAVGIDRSLKSAWKAAADQNPEFWKSFQTWTNINYTRVDPAAPISLEFVNQIKPRLGDNQPLSCVGAPTYTKYLPQDLKIMFSNLPGDMFMQVDGRIEFASKTDANTQHTRAYEKDASVKEKSVDLTFISGDRGTDDNMLTGAQGEPVFDGNYNEIIVADWSPGEGLLLPYTDMRKGMDLSREFFTVLQPAYENFKKVYEQRKRDNPYRKSTTMRGSFKSEVKKNPGTYSDLVAVITKLNGGSDYDSFTFYLGASANRSIFNLAGQWLSGETLSDKDKFMLNYIQRYVKKLFNGNYELIPETTLANHMIIYNTFFKDG